MIENNLHNNIWIGTGTNGIIIYDRDTIFNINTKNGLSNNNINSFFKKDTIIWVSTQNGLNKITLLSDKINDKYKIEIFSTLDGLASNEINDIYIKDLTAYVASKKGLSKFNTKKLITNSYPPPIYINNVSILEKDTSVQSSYILSHKNNSINIEFVGLNYKNQYNKTYKYQIVRHGQEANWIETNENHVRLSFLPPGQYTFKVLAINENNIESINPASVDIFIKPPYWKSWWFIGLIIISTIIIIAGVLLTIYYIKISEIKRRNTLERKLLLEINKFRQQALSQQMNPHFIFNTLNSIQFYIYDNDINSSTQYLSKFSKLMRVILNNSQHDTIPVQKELEAMQLYLELESMRLENQLNYEISTNDVDVELYQIHPLLIQPYVENSIWHGLVHKEGEKNIKIEVRNNKDSILCIIEDDGIGRQKAMEIREKKNKRHISYGTNITGKRIDSINKLFNQDFKVEYIDLKDDNGNACGTKVLLQILRFQISYFLPVRFLSSLLFDTSLGL